MVLTGSNAIDIFSRGSSMIPLTTFFLYYDCKYFSHNCPNNLLDFIPDICNVKQTAGKGHDTPLGHGNIYQIQLESKELWPGHGFWLCLLCDLGDVTLGQGYGIPLCHGQQSHGNFIHRETSLSQTHSSIILSLLEVWCEILSRSDKGHEDMVRTQSEQTDGQGDSYIQCNLSKPDLV